MARESNVHRFYYNTRMFFPIYSLGKLKSQLCGVSEFQDFLIVSVPHCVYTVHIYMYDCAVALVYETDFKRVKRPLG